MSTIIIGAIVLLAFIISLRKIIRDRKDTGSCGCSCGQCPSANNCSSSKQHQ